MPLDHVGVYAKDLSVSKAFYLGALRPLRYKVFKEVKEGDNVLVVGLGDPHPNFWLAPATDTTKGAIPRVHVAFAASSHAHVDQFYAAALAAGGKDNGAPGYRKHYHPMYYAAFVLDPDGNNVEAVSPRQTWQLSTQTTAAAVASQERKSGASKARESKGLIDLNPPKGTRDFPPDEARLRQWLFGEFEAVSRLFGFQLFDAPVLESEELYVRKSGEEISDQLFNFEDKGGRRVALRPELTPSLARLVLKQGKQLSLPAKWYTIGQCWRYERMTRGRRREHYQWNMDIIGVAGVEAEAELLAAITMFLERLGLSAEDVAIKVSSRKVLQAVMQRYGIPDDMFGQVCVLVDKIEKLPMEKVEEEFGALGVPAEAAQGIIGATTISSLAELEAFLGAGHEAVADLKRLFELAEATGYGDYLVLDTSISRGLAYYTSTVFEGRDRKGELRAIFGGGRYDKLLGTFGGEQQPCAGFGFGDAVIVELLRDKGLLPEIPHQVDDVVVVMDEQLRPQANRIAHKLRQSGRVVDLVLESKKMKWVFKHVERCHAARLILVAPDEWAKGTVRVKDLAQRSEEDVSVLTEMRAAKLFICKADSDPREHQDPVTFVAYEDLQQSPVLSSVHLPSDDSVELELHVTEQPAATGSTPEEFANTVRTVVAPLVAPLATREQLQAQNNTVQALQEAIRRRKAGRSGDLTTPLLHAEAV
ncbi:hypothetical protein WJX72_005451 [[Myrmecia] bisecta]|uniref:histidine--tRNA ligase n=1 Tax=[Myrmecia] bisecta TaxID=41462 RepID=A0AAW1Q0D6_9CHLO